LPLKRPPESLLRRKLPDKQQKRPQELLQKKKLPESLLR